MVVLVREKQPGFLLVADKAVNLLQKGAAFHRNAHVRDGGVDLLVVFFGVAQDLLDGRFFQIQLEGDAVAVGKDLVALFFQQLGQRGGVRPLGDGGADIAVVVKHGQPGAHAVRYFFDVSGIDLVLSQLVDNVLARACVVHQADKGGPQLHIGNILCHVAAHAAVDLLDPARVASAGNVGGERIPLDIHKHRTDDYDTHTKKPFLYHKISSIVA